MARKKANGTAGIEVAYADGESLGAAVEDALETALASGKVIDLPDDRYAVATEAPLAAILRPSETTEVLHVARPRRGLPSREWLPTARLDLRTVGSHRLWMARRFRAGLSARSLAALEAAYGFDGYSAYLASEFTPAEPTKLDGAAEIVDPRRRTKVVHIRHRGLWWGAWRVDGPMPRPEAPRPPSGGRAFPNVSIT